MNFARSRWRWIGIALITGLLTLGLAGSVAAHETRRVQPPWEPALGPNPPLPPLARVTVCLRTTVRLSRRNQRQRATPETGSATPHLSMDGSRVAK